MNLIALIMLKDLKYFVVLRGRRRAFPWGGRTLDVTGELSCRLHKAD